jgi:glutathione S-transferase
VALRFYMTPGSCSTGIHILLETLELPFEAWIVNLPAGEHLRPEYLKINPRGTIPTLVLDDGRALTDFRTIALWLAERYPRGKLLPEDPVLAAHAVELLDFALFQLHAEGFTRIFTTERYLSSGEAQQGRHLHDDIAAHGREIVCQAFEALEKRIPETGYAVSPQFSIADAALFYNEFWADKTGIPLPPRVAAHYQRVRACPAVRRVLAEEGYRS